MSLAYGAACAQPPGTPPRFDVASIKADRSGVNGSSISRSGGRINLEHVSLKECVEFAYGIATGRDYQLSAPRWLDGEKFDIVATFSPDVSRAQLREIGRGGAKLSVTSSGTEGAFVWGEGQLTARAISMKGLSERLSGPAFNLSKPVVDKTGIKGSYNFILKWAPDDSSADGSSGPSIFTALQDQLGLRLEPRKLSFRILVVDHAG